MTQMIISCNILKHKGLFMITLNIIGAGRLGKTLGRLLRTNTDVTIQGICNRSLESTRAAIAFIGEGEAYEDIESLPPANITLITTPDDVIQATAIKLSSSSNLMEESIACHFSGALSSEILYSLETKGCNTMSAHPMHSFAKPELSLSSFEGTFCAVEGDEKSQELMTPLLIAIGAQTFILDSDKKSLYHSAGVIASNYLVTLCEQAKLNLVDSGIEQQTAIKIVTSLMEGTVQNIKATLSPESSLTGPIKRGDSETVLSHMKSIPGDRRKLFYSFLADLTLDISGLSQDKEKEVRSALKLYIS